MTKAEFISKVDSRTRRYFTKLPSKIVSLIYSTGRKYFIKTLANEIPKTRYVPADDNCKKLWDIKFNSSLFNAAGMFKNGEGYYTVAAQGAGAYLAGTTTSSPRTGNTKYGIRHPFIPYHFSGSASNWMGLPNEGHEIVANRLSKIRKIDGCPIGISLSINPDGNQEEALHDLIDGMKIFELANVDFIELNESCPNVSHEKDIDTITNLDKNLIDRLNIIKEKFLRNRRRNLPVIIKLSIDTDESMLTSLINILLDMEFDGLNLGNTSTDYGYFKSLIDSNDINNYEYFTKKFGGGVSGRVLKDRSLKLASFSSRLVASKNIKKEFNIIRTGGIEEHEDLINSEKSNISLNQWFTGYFNKFSENGHSLYKLIL